MHVPLLHKSGRNCHFHLSTHAIKIPENRLRDFTAKIENVIENIKPLVDIKNAAQRIALVRTLNIVDSISDNITVILTDVIRDQI